MLDAVIWLLGLFVLTVTLLPLTHGVAWWVRMWDFPRLHIAILALFVCALAIFVAPAFYGWIVATMLGCFVYQAIRIFPYTPLAKTEVELVKPPKPRDVVSMLSVNVLMENTRHGDLIAIIEREDPDVLFLMETDEVWHNALKGVLARYKVVKTRITDDHYGLIFATRCEVDSFELMTPSNDDTAALKAVLRAPNGACYNFIGLHPRPPVPGNDTISRDEQIKEAALITSSSERPTVCMGDFNDAAWSWTSRRFKRYGGFLEPRVGRGLLSSFHAQHPLVRVPIDQLFVTKSVHLVAFYRLENFGSDHFPIAAKAFFDAPEGTKT